MSQYKQCRSCGTDLGQTGHTSFGVNECCCNNGYCHACCEAGEDTE